MIENYIKIHNAYTTTNSFISTNERCLKQAICIVEDNLNDYTFGINEFASEMANSKSTLRKKLKSLTGLSSVEFIREIRLKYAIIMLTSKSESISEIAYSVGFNDTKYFSRCFKNEFGLGPKAYREKYERIESEDCIKQSLPKEVNF